MLQGILLGTFQNKMFLASYLDRGQIRHYAGRHMDYFLTSVFFRTGKDPWDCDLLEEEQQDARQAPLAISPLKNAPSRLSAFWGWLAKQMRAGGLAQFARREHRKRQLFLAPTRCQRWFLTIPVSNRSQSFDVAKW